MSWSMRKRNTNQYRTRWIKLLQNWRDTRFFSPPEEKEEILEDCYYTLLISWYTLYNYVYTVLLLWTYYLKEKNYFTEIWDTAQWAIIVLVFFLWTTFNRVVLSFSFGRDKYIIYIKADTMYVCIQRGIYLVERNI